MQVCYALVTFPLKGNDICFIKITNKAFNTGYKLSIMINFYVS